MKGLISIFIFIFVLAGCASPSPQLTHDKMPEKTTPAPTQNLQTQDTHTQPQEIPHYEITLLSFNGVVASSDERRAYIYFSGEVRNDSDVTLDAVETVITSYNENNEVIAVDRWHTDPWIIEPGETSQFGVQVTNYVTAVKYEVSFEQLHPSILDLSVGTDVSKIFRVSRY